MTHISKDIQIIILSFIPQEINYLKILVLVSKKYNKLFLSKLEYFYWNLLKKNIGKFWSDIFFNGHILINDHVCLKNVINNNNVRILGKAMIEYNKRCKNNHFNFTNKWNRFIIQLTDISDTNELRLRKIWTDKLGKKNYNLYIERTNISDPITIVQQENIYLAEKFWYSFKGFDIVPLYVCEYVNKHDHKIDRTNFITKPIKKSTHSLEIFKNIILWLLVISIGIYINLDSYYALKNIFFKISSYV